ncbi:MAG: hypothetical protein IJ667_06970 [Synergistaceae bacterium]|nr:hypothetical protein [Synergistaceae bacterium]
MNTDIRLSVNFWRNHKIKKLERHLGLEGVKSLQILWLWAAQNRPSGVLNNMDADDIECDAEWNGEQDAFINELIDLKLIDVAPDGTYLLHDWEQNNEWASQAETRADKARLSRLAQVNPDAYNKLKEKGVTAISREEYDKLTAETRIDAINDVASNADISSATANFGECTATAALRAGSSSCSLPSPEPVPAPEPEPNPTSSEPTALRQDAQCADACEAEAEAAPDAKNITLNELLALWNEILTPLNFPQALKATPAREKAFKARLNALKERNNADWWRGILNKLAASSFMLESAKNKANWLTLDWLLNENNLVKICECKYDNRPKSKQEPPRSFDEALSRLTPHKPPTFDEAMRRYGFSFNGANSDVIDVTAQARCIA